MRRSEWGKKAVASSYQPADEQISRVVAEFRMWMRVLPSMSEWIHRAGVFCHILLLLAVGLGRSVAREEGDGRGDPAWRQSAAYSVPSPVVGSLRLPEVERSAGFRGGRLSRQFAGDGHDAPGAMDVPMGMETMAAEWAGATGAGRFAGLRRLAWILGRGRQPPARAPTQENELAATRRACPTRL